MADEPKSFWWKFWGRPVHFFSWLTVISLLGGVAAIIITDRIHRELNWNDFAARTINLGLCAVFIAATLGLILSAIPWTRSLMKWVLRRWFFCAAALATLIGLFYAEENWRGKRAWENCKRDLEAKGETLDWKAHVPPPILDAHKS